MRHWKEMLSLTMAARKQKAIGPEQWRSNQRKMQEYHRHWEEGMEYDKKKENTVIEQKIKGGKSINL